MQLARRVLVAIFAVITAGVFRAYLYGLENLDVENHQVRVFINFDATKSSARADAGA